MNEIANNFFKFLQKKQNETGQKSFFIEDYMEFDGYERAISELVAAGKITKSEDIVEKIDLIISED